jgi:hypothetical protein
VADLPTQRDFDDFSAWTGRDVLGPDGERLGAVEVIFLDEATGVPEWVLVSVDDGPAFVPLAGATVEERSIRVEQTRERIAGAPRPEPAETLSVADERRLYEHYGLAYSQAESASVLPEGAAASEERPRLRKYVGAPVPAPAAEETPAPAAASPTPSPLPPPAPRVIPPPGGFQAEEEEPGSRLSRLAARHRLRLAAVLRPRTAIPALLAGAIAGLIAVLAYRRR